MTSKRDWGLGSLLGCLLALTLMAALARAQEPTPSPSPSPEGPAEVQPDPQPADPQTDAQPSATTYGERVGNYRVISSIEFGARGLRVVGDENKYRSDLDYRPGFRIFESSFLMTAPQGEGGIIDSFLVNSTGWGGDPHGHLRVSAERAGWYRFDGQYRRFRYFNNLRTIALNQHTNNTTLQFGDFDLTLFPQHRLYRFHIGYSPEYHSGPAVSTTRFSGDEFAVGSGITTHANNLRLGADTRVWGINLSFLQGFRWFREETTYTVTSLNPGNNATNTAVINAFQRNLPTRGRTAFSRFSAQTTINRRLDITARYIYSGSTTDFSLFEQITGRDASNNRVTLNEIASSGTAKRPTRMADFGITWLATDRLRISNTFRFNSFNISGSDRLGEALLRTNPAGTATLAPVFTNTLGYRDTRYRRYMNTIEADYQFNLNYSAHIGYRFADRHVELGALNQNLAQAPAAIGREVADNRTHGLIFGFRARPIPQWTAYFDLERGSADNVFTRLSNYDYTNVRLRNRINPNRRLALNVSFIARENSNPSLDSLLPPLSVTNPALQLRDFGADISTRIFTSSLDWSPGARFNLSAGYTYTHVTSEADIIVPVAGVRRQGLSQYFLRDHSFFLHTTAQPHPRISLFAGYRINKDTGQDDRISTAPEIIISSYPMHFQSPEVRVAVRINHRLDWNIGYQYYNYHETYLLPQNLILNPQNLTPSNISPQNYHAHLPFMSLRIYLGRERRERN